MIKWRVDIFPIDKTKLGKSFPSNQFVMTNRRTFWGESAFYTNNPLSSQTIKIEILQTLRL